jgi:hypothetical protein
MDIGPKQYCLILWELGQPRRLLPRVHVKSSWSARQRCFILFFADLANEKSLYLTSPSEATLEILAKPEVLLARRVTNWLLAAATAKDSVFAGARSSGSAPRRLYEHLAGPPYRGRDENDNFG